MEKLISQELCDYIEGLHFHMKSLESIMKIQALQLDVPVEINEDVRSYYLRKYEEAFMEYEVAMNQLRQDMFPEFPGDASITVDFNKQTVTLVQSTCSCGGRH